jgi:hypothetical protein
MRFLLVLLAVQAAILWSLAHHPLTPVTLLGWAIGLYSVGWTLYSLWERASTPRSHHVDSRRSRS